MLARKYIKKILINTTQKVEDGYGGYTVDFVGVGGSFWAEVKQLSAFRENQSGQLNIKDAYSFKIRATADDDLLSYDNLQIFYRGAYYTVTDINYADENFRFLNIVAHG